MMNFSKMNVGKEAEKKLDGLLSRLPKPQHDIDKWLSEDHIAEFDEMIKKNNY